MNLFSLLDHSGRCFPDHGAVFRGTELILRYGELRRRALQLAAALRGLHAASTRVAIASENAPEYIELMFGAWAAGMAVVPVNAKLHVREMLQIIEDATPCRVFASPKLAPELAAVSPAEVITIGSPAYASLFGAPLEAPADTAPEALAWLFYTSGTTGRSKGAMLSHRNLLAMTVAHLADVENFDEDASQIHAAPMSHGSGLYVPAYVSRGARQVVPASGGFDPAEFVELCNVHPACGAFLAPTMVQRLRQEVEQSGRRLEQLRTIVYGGGPMYLQEIRKSLQVFGQVFAQIYGQGESPMTITSLRRRDHELQDDAILASVGRARTGVDVAVVDADGCALPDGEIGEIVCRGDVVMSGYWNNPAATRDALRNGWLWTGDMGSMDARGYLTLRDRSKDVVITGGSNVYPREVEEVLLAHPAVSEACVVGEPHEEWGEIVVAFVVPNASAQLTADELDRHCLEHIARFKRPKRYCFVDALPKNSYGKVLKRELRARMLAGPAADGDSTA